MQTNIDTHNATILEIVRMSTEDGPGIRTTVFFKGCTLSCDWCHNPESISLKPQLHWVGSRCIGCKTCLELCKEGALEMTDAGMKIARNKCIGCGDCAKECPGTALELMGQSWQLDDLVEEALKDRAYFETSSGGITISGGEPTLQAGFAGAFLKALRGKGIHTALDTCGQCSRQSLDHILPYAAMVLFDIKMIDPGNHKKYTGHDNKQILINLLVIAEYIKAHVYPNELWIRTPMIPNATATYDNIMGIGKFISENLPNVVKRWELCAFNNLCRDKYRRLDKPWAFHDTDLLTLSALSELEEIAKKSGVDPEMVFATGSTRMETTDHKEERHG